MACTLAHLAHLVDGTLVGDGEVQIANAATLSDALQGDITFIDHADKAQRFHSAASAVVVPRDVRVEGCPNLVVDDVHAAFRRIIEFFRPPRSSRRLGISPHAHVSPTARIANDVDIHPGATIGDEVEIGSGSTIHAGAHVMAGCKLGPNVTVFPSVVLYENTIVGARCIIHAGAVLGAYGFGFTQVDGRHQPAAQLGFVELADDVEVGACTTIDRGTYGRTYIGEGTKFDNQVQIGHNCRIGRHNLICSQVGVAGSTSTGDWVVMAGQAGIRDHVHIGDGAVLGAMSGVSNDVPAGAQVLGIPATPIREQRLKQAALSRLPEMRREMKALMATVAELERLVKPDAPQAAA